MLLVSSRLKPNFNALEFGNVRCADSGPNPKKTNLGLIFQDELHNQGVSPCNPLY